MLDHTKKRYMQEQSRSPKKMVGGVKSRIESNPIPSRDAQRAQTKPCEHLETPQRLSQTCLWVFDCLLWRYGSAVACHRSRGSGCSRPGCGISPLGGGHHWSYHTATRTYTGLGKQDLEGHKQNLVGTGKQEKAAVNPQETDLDFCVSVQESLAEAWIGHGLLHGWGHWLQQWVHGTFWMRSPLSSLPPP